MLAERMGEAPALLSYHLRQLADHGFIEEAPELARHGREHWWRGAAERTSWSTTDFLGTPERTVYIWTGARGPLHSELLHERVPAAQRATMLSVNSLAAMVGGLVAGLTLPRLADVAGIPAAWLVAAGLLAASAWCYAAIRPHVGATDRMGGVAHARR